MKRLICCILLMGTTHPGFTQSAAKRTYTTQRIQSIAPQIDGRLDDTCWQEGGWEGDFRQFMPTEGAPPSQNTLLKILYDDKNLYVAFKAYDTEPEKIDRRASRRDGLSGGDVVGICLDSYFDHLNGFEFDITAAGTKIDLILMNNFRWDTNWDAVWEGKTAAMDSGWCAEMRIPFSQLRYTQQPEQVWGLHAWRWINRGEEEVQFSLIPRNGPGHIHDMGFLRGLRDLPKSRQIEFLPYTVGSMRLKPAAAGSQRDKNDWQAKAGLDGKIGVSSNYTIDYTMNPDFGQVEADPSVLNLSVYEVFYNEKRPFFLEGMNLFDFGLGDDKLFYSRRIGHAPSYQPQVTEGGHVNMPENTAILGAVKLTGKSGNGLSVGIIESVTQKERAELIMPSGSTNVTVEPASNYLVTSLRKESNHGNTLAGGLFTMTHRSLRDHHLDFLSRRAYSGGVDFVQYFKNKKYDLGVKWIGSLVEGSPPALLRLQTASARYFQRLDADHLEVDSSRTSLAGHGGELYFRKSSYGHWRYRTGVKWRSPGLELNDLGYLRAADDILTEASTEYVENEPGSWFRSYSLAFWAGQHWNFDAKNPYTEVSSAVNASFRNRWRFRLGLNRISSLRDARLLRGGPSLKVQGFWCGNVNMSTDPGRPLVIEGLLHHHRYDDGQSCLWGGTTTCTYKLNEALLLAAYAGLNHEKELLHYIATVPDQQPRYILGTLDRRTADMTFRIDYAVTPDLTIQYYGSPYISMGHYTGLRRVVDAAADDYRTATRPYTTGEFQRGSGLIRFEEAGAAGYTLADPDFNFREFRSNLVLRWEVRTGSTLYLVWSHGRSSYESVYSHDWSSNLDRLWNARGEHILLAKFSYWFAL